MPLWIALVLFLYIIQIATVLVREYCRPHKAVAWLVILYFIPLAGFLLYVFAAREYSCYSFADRREEPLPDRVANMLKERAGKHRPAHTDIDACRTRPGAAKYFPVTAGNVVDVFLDGKDAFAAMLGAIRAAEHHIHIECYIIRDDALGASLQQLLIRKAREGVRVRLLYDGIGSRRLPAFFLRKLRDAGVETGNFFPPLAAFFTGRINYRNHRKIVVVDGKVGFIGGMNIGDEYLGNHPKIGYWRDTLFSVQGDAVAWIQYTFLSDWHMVKGQRFADSVYYPVQKQCGDESVQIVKSGPDESILELLFTLIVSAKRRIYIETPYFVPDPGLLLALKSAVCRGVDIRVIIPAVPDSKFVYCASLSYVRELLPAGIRFYRYRKGFLHAKALICDNIACSGSSNMDMRSLAGQFEIDAMFRDGLVVNRLVHAFHLDLADSEEFSAETLDERSGIAKLGEVFARLLSPLF